MVILVYHVQKAPNDNKFVFFSPTFLLFSRFLYHNCLSFAWLKVSVPIMWVLLCFVLFKKCSLFFFNLLCILVIALWPLWLNRCSMCKCKGSRMGHSKSTHSQKPWLSMIEHGHYMDGWLFCLRLFAPTIGNFPGVKTLCRLYFSHKSFGWDCWLRSHVYKHANQSHVHIKDPVVLVRVWWVMETQAYPACTIVTN